jgi:hypothetical protein
MWIFVDLINRQAVFGRFDFMSLNSLWLLTCMGRLGPGWITTPLGAGAGWLLVSLQRALASAGQAHPSDSRRAATTREDTP